MERVCTNQWYVSDFYMMLLFPMSYYCSLERCSQRHISALYPAFDLVVHVRAADVFAVCGRAWCQMSQLTQRKQPWLSVFQPNLSTVSLGYFTHRRLVKELWHIPPICKSLLAAINTLTCLWLHSIIVLQHNKNVNRSGRCLASLRRSF